MKTIAKAILAVVIAFLAIRTSGMAAVIVLNPIEDTQVDLNNLSTNFGTSPTLQAGADNYPLFKFDFSGVNFALVTSVRFVLTLTSGTASNFVLSDPGFTWSEAAAPQPPLTSAGIGTTKGTLSGAELSWNHPQLYTWASTGPAVKDLMLEPGGGPGSGTIGFGSNQAPFGKPRLELTQVPEPSSAALLLLGAASLAGRRRRP